MVTVTASGFGTARRAWPPRFGRSLQIDLVAPAFLRGTLRDAATRVPLDGSVTVWVRHPDNVVSDAARAEQGVVLFEDLPPGPVVMLARAEGFAPFVGTTTLVAGSMRDVSIDLLLEAVIMGLVTTQDGSPVVGAPLNVRYSHTANGLLKGFVGGSPITDSQGVFVLDGIVPDTPISLRAEIGNGKLSNVVTVTVAPGTVQHTNLVVPN